MAYPCTEIEVASLSDYRNISGVQKIKNWTGVFDNAPFLWGGRQ